MARVNESLFKDWQDGQTVNAVEYKREREILRVAVNDTWDRFLTEETGLQGLKDETLALVKDLKDIDFLEDDRKSSEILRISEENIRINTEIARMLAESSREVQETQRQLNTTTALSAVGQALTDVQQARNESDISTANANTAATNATTQGDYAKNQGEYAKIQGDNAKINGMYATEQGDYAKTQGDTAKTNSLHAQTQGDYAKTQGNYAKTEADAISSTVTQMNTRIDNIVTSTGDSNTEVVDARLGADGKARATLGELTREIHSQIIDQDRQTQLLQTGTNVINANIGTPVDFEIQGRTLVNLLGKDGNFENGGGFTLVRSASIVTDWKLYGNESLKLIASDAYAYKDLNNLEEGKFYIVLCEGKSDVDQDVLNIFDAGGFLNRSKAIIKGGSVNEVVYLKFTGRGGVRVSLGRHSGTNPTEINVDGVRIYEVSQSEYDKIGVSWDDAEVAKRYPYVDGVQHLVNPYVLAEGENLLPPFSEWTLHANASVISPYELELNATGTSQNTTININCVKNTNYTVSVEHNARISITDGDNTVTIVAPSSLKTIKFNSLNFEKIRIWVSSASLGTGKFTFTNPILTLGDNPKPFVPRNPSYLYADAKLGQIGDKRDILYKEDRQWKVRKVIEKDVVLDGSLGFKSGVGYEGSRTLSLLFSFLPSQPMSTYGKGGYEIVKDNNGNVYKHYDTDAANKGGNHATITVSSVVFLVSNEKTGFNGVYTPTDSDAKRYFNGWKYTDGVTWTSVTGNGQTATVQQALDTKPTDYTPYKLSYVLATPVVENVKIEGDIVASGLTQIEVGSGVIVREKATPIMRSETSGNFYQINRLGRPESFTKHKVKSFLSVYKENVDESSKWEFISSSDANTANGYRVRIPESQFDPTADYYVTYLALDKHEMTTNPIDVKATYAKQLRPAHDDLAVKVSDLATDVSININTLAEMYKRIRQLEGV